MKPGKWIRIEWEPSVETFMIDLHHETGPPGHNITALALGRQEAMELRDALNKALRTKVSRSAQKVGSSND